MSAFDIAGAVVWTTLALCFSGATSACHKKGDADAVMLGFVVTAATLAAAVFCIARLFGAHL